MNLRVHRWSKREGRRGIRAFATLYGREDMSLVEGRFEGYIASGASHTGVSLRSDEDALQVFVGLAHVADAWVTVGSWPLLKRYPWLRVREDMDIVDFRYHDRAVWWSFWHPTHSWSSKTPRWRHGSFHWWDFVAGKPVHRSEPEAPVPVGVPMPEGTYRAVVTMSRNAWKRPRWPWPKVSRSYDIDVLSRPTPEGPRIEHDDGGEPLSGYIPVPGKGENAWDCGGDGIFSQSGGARTVEEAVGHLVASALNIRKRYGGDHEYSEPIS